MGRRRDLTGARAHTSVDDWLRRNGLPYFVVRRYRLLEALLRSVPFLVFFAPFWVVLDLLAAVSAIGTIGSVLAVTTTTDALLLLLVVLLLVALVVGVPILVALGVARWIRRRPRARYPLLVVVLAWYLVLQPLMQDPPLNPRDVLTEVAINLGVVVAVTLATWSGLGALFGWSLRAALGGWTALGALATRVLPLLMLVVVFAFFARALWEVTSAMTPERLLMVATLFAVLGLGFIYPISHSRLAGISIADISDSEIDKRVRTTGLTQLVGRVPSRRPLRRLERANVEWVFMLALMFQVLFFAILVWAFLVLLGTVAIDGRVLAEWGGEPAYEVALFGVPVPISPALISTAVLLACVSSLNFLVSVTANETYRTAFYDPLIDEVETALAVRAAYLGEPPASSTPAND